MPTTGSVGGPGRVDEGVWRRLGRVAPVAPELVEWLHRLDGIGLRELEARLAACDAQLRAWAARPENRTRPVRDAPRRLERLALGTLLERRLWWE